MMGMDENKRRAILAILLVAPIPALNLLISQYSGSGAIGQMSFVLSKCWLLAVPL